MSTGAGTVPHGFAQGAPFRLFFMLSASLLLVITSPWLPDTQSLALAGCALGFIVLCSYKFDYLNPAVAFLVPWLAVLFFSTLPISEYSRSLDAYTCGLLLLAMLSWLLATVSAPAIGSSEAAPAAALTRGDEGQHRRTFRLVLLAFLFLYAFAAFNVAYAGYVPMIALLTTGDSGYAAFGIPSVYGAFLAYSNALACVALYIYLRHGQRKFLILFLSVLCMHLLLVSRQNLITLLIEAFVLRCLISGRVSRTTIVVSISLVLTAFAALGQLRSGDIGEVMRVNPSLSWIPTSFLWLYGYSYFNVLNLENMIVQSGAPFYDGSMWDNLLPSVLRPNVDHGVYLELEALNVSSYVYPVYLDVGAIGVLASTAFWGLVTAHVYRRALSTGLFVYVASYACLFGCALLSFFVNFWFYLPVVFQIVFFWVFHMLLFRTPVSRRIAIQDPAHSGAAGAQS
jgi:oligosaccharide repeat unit polymerase